MKLKVFISFDMGENCYFVIDEKTKDTIVIDPGNEGEKLCCEIEKGGFNVKAICLTHAHFDHCGAVKEIKEKTGAKVIICDGEQTVASSPSYNLSAMFSKPFTVEYDKVVKDGDFIEVGNLVCKVIATPGHTEGGCCYYFEKEGVVFSGDTLFFMSVGRTDFPGGNSKKLVDSIKNKLFTLPLETVVYSGHGQQTQIGYEIENNSYL